MSQDQGQCLCVSTCRDKVLLLRITQSIGTRPRIASRRIPIHKRTWSQNTGLPHSNRSRAHEDHWRATGRGLQGHTSLGVRHGPDVDPKGMQCAIGGRWTVDGGRRTATCMIRPSSGTNSWPGLLLFKTQVAAFGSRLWQLHTSGFLIGEQHRVWLVNSYDSPALATNTLRLLHFCRSWCVDIGVFI